MKIAIITSGQVKVPPEYGGGVEGVAWNISRHLNLTNQVTLFDAVHGPGDSHSEVVDGVRIMRVRAIKFHLVPFALPPPLTALEIIGISILNQLSFAFRVGRFLKNHLLDFDVVHVHSIFVGIVLVLMGFGKKIVYTSHVNTWVSYRPSILDMLGFRLEIWLLKNVRAVSVLSLIVKTRMTILGGVPEGDIRVIPNGTDTEFFSPCSVDPLACRESSNGLHTILFVGRISKVKGVDFLIEALDRIVNRDHLPGIKLVLVGPAETFSEGGLKSRSYRDDLNRLIRYHGLEKIVEFKGGVTKNELRGLYQSSEFVVVPSRTEATPLVTIEAMACAKPVICSSVGGTTEQIENGRNGYLVPVGDIESLASCMKYLILNPSIRRTMGFNARMLVEKRFDWKVIAADYERMYYDSISALEKSRRFGLVNE